MENISLTPTMSDYIERAPDGMIQPDRRLTSLKASKRTGPVSAEDKERMSAQLSSLLECCSVPGNGIVAFIRR